VKVHWRLLLISGHIALISAIAWLTSGSSRNVTSYLAITALVIGSLAQSVLLFGGVMPDSGVQQLRLAFATMIRLVGTIALATSISHPSVVASLLALACFVIVIADLLFMNGGRRKST
jgi:hypothetical protein